MTGRSCDYGIDAPGVVRNLLVAGGVLLAAVFMTPDKFQVGEVTVLVHPSMIWTGCSCLFSGLLMILYAKRGKFIHRDRMLGWHTWRGDEEVLDVGTGRGLLLVGAAKRLATGHGIGVDIWNAEDLSGNAREQTQTNLELEGVADKCTLVSEGAQKMTFSDASFDVVVSNLCLHNIYKQSERKKACHEIARVLKPGGVAIISDFKLCKEYTVEFRKAGLHADRKSPNWLTTFPPLTIVVARKAPANEISGMKIDALP